MAALFSCLNVMGAMLGASARASKTWMTCDPSSPNTVSTPCASRLATTARPGSICSTVRVICSVACMPPSSGCSSQVCAAGYQPAVNTCASDDACGTWSGAAYGVDRFPGTPDTSTMESQDT